MKLNRRALLSGLGSLSLLGCRRAVGEEPPAAEPPAAALSFTPTPPSTDFQAGMALAHIHRGGRGYGSATCLETLKALAAVGVTHISVTPFAYQRGLDATSIRFGDGLDRSLPDRCLLELAAQARSVGLGVCVKPHIWSKAFWLGGSSRQDINPGSPEAWRSWFESYTAFAVHYAALAERMGAALYCVGLEYLLATQENPGAWAAVASACRAVYGGALTYAANWWQEADIFSDWAAFDAIGVNAYPPLSDRPDPTLAELASGWSTYLDTLGRLHRTHDRPVVLTEAGLRARRGAAAAPWDQGLSGASDPVLQARVYEALLHEGSQRPWIEGVYFWKTMTDSSHEDAYVPTAEARAVLQRWWAPA